MSFELLDQMNNANNGSIFPDWSEHNINFSMLENRLSTVKKEFGLRKAISVQSLSGESRTFAELLDLEVERVVLFYLRAQGVLANQVWILRVKQQSCLQTGYIASQDKLTDLLKDYRLVSHQVLRLLEYLELNTMNLRKILMQHDLLFDTKLSILYFDTRVCYTSPLLQLYHQEGLIAIISTLKRAFEDIYEAQETLNIRFPHLIDNLDVVMDTHTNIFRGPSSGVGDLNAGLKHRRDVKLPRVPYFNRIQSASNLYSQSLLSSFENNKNNSYNSGYKTKLKNQQKSTAADKKKI